MKAQLIVTMLALLAAGCGNITQRVDPVAKVQDKQICVERNPGVREGFLDSYQKALERKGFHVVVVPETAVPPSCTLVSSYRAGWGYSGFTASMLHADIRVLKDGQLVGRAIYDATRSRSPEKMINADSKVVELVNQLFPDR